ncbi:VTC domain-containing protein [Kalaharituber pfeilii]|nr:VTC domain-containing protein [Kalaharituber pfeilii]
MVRPLLQVRMSALDFNKEVYSPMLYRLSAMYAFVRQQLEDGQVGQTQPRAEQNQLSMQSSTGTRYTSHKFWVHPDNYLEVKTHIVRRLPVLVYNPKHKKQIDVPLGDPTINSVYFDNDKFLLYTDKVEKKPGATSLRLRWYGQLASKPDINLERKTMQSAPANTETANVEGAAAAAAASDGDSEGAIEERITFKEKYVEAFIRGEYPMDKNLQKMRDRQDKNAQDVEKYEALVKDLQAFIKSNNLQPMMRAVYNRSAFQIPGDDSIRVSLDTNLAFIREDALDPERPCRDPENWHRKDIDDAQMEFPFSSVNKGEIHRFPYAVLEIKIRDNVPQRNVKWVYELMTSHLVSEAPRFSKFVHGVSTLFEDYVNILPFWHSELDKDIRKDPESAWQQEQQRRAKQVEEDHAVGSLRVGSVFGLGGRFGSVPRAGVWPSQMGTPGTSYEPERTLKLGSTPVGTPTTKGGVMEAMEEVADDADNISLFLGGERESTEPTKKSRLLDLFPGFSTSRYGRRHRQKRGEDDVPLPPGVTKPEKLLMHSTPVNVEPKVWLANQRTFIKWEHVSILLATLSLGLYNAAGQHNQVARTLGLVYTGIALFTGIWGYWVYIERSKMIMERSGKDFDKRLGPVVVCVSLVVALILNFTFKYNDAMEKHKKHFNDTEVVGDSNLVDIATKVVVQVLETAVGGVGGYADDEL